MSTTILYGDEKLALKVETISTARTLTASDSGKYFTLSASAGVAVTLPSVTVAGFRARFTVGSAFATTNFTIVAPTAVIQGSADVNSTLVPASNENTISFVASAETVGDFIEIYSDGTNFYAYGIGQASGSVTFTVA
jgi:hypothetical protein